VRASVAPGWTWRSRWRHGMSTFIAVGAHADQLQTRSGCEFADPKDHPSTAPVPRLGLLELRACMLLFPVLQKPGINLI